MGSYIRSPKTHQEMAHFVVEEVKLRSKRSPALLPTAWTDIIRRSQRCWKKYRPSQWK